MFALRKKKPFLPFQLQVEKILGGDGLKKKTLLKWVKGSCWFESHMLWPAQYSKGHIQLLLYKINTQEIKSSTS